VGLHRYTRWTLLRELGLSVVAVIFSVPFYLLIAIALETTAQTYKTPLSFPRPPQWSNFSVAWQTGGQAGLGRSLESSLVITVSSVAALIVLGSLCAYTIARRSGGRLSGAVYILFVLGIILPFQLAIIPLFAVMHHLGLTGDYAGMIVLNVGLMMPLTVFLYTGFIRALPRDYEEAARVDGAGILRTYVRVVLPLLRPVTGTVAVLIGIVVWNEFFTARVFLDGSRSETLPVAVSQFAGDYLGRPNLEFAGVLIALAPVLVFYLFAQRQLIRGFSGGLKG
jgi:raffinose/stachyose/melibiose transport system permease protein